MSATKRENVHIPYDQTIKPYHEVVAELICTYAKATASVADIGCGLGYTLEQIQKRRPEMSLTAIDIDINCLNTTAQRARLAQRICIRDIDELRTMGLSFDAIILSHSLEHMRRPVDTLLDLYSMVEPGGIMALAVPNPVRPTVFVGNIFKRHYVNRGHVCAWDRSHWINFLEEICKLEVVEYSQDYVPLPLLNRLSLIVPFERMLARIFPWLAFSNIAIIKKPA